MKNRHITKDSTVNTFLKTVLTLVVLSVLFSALLPAQEKEITEGKTAMANGDFIRAIDRFREAVKKDRMNIESNELLVQALFQADSLDAIPMVIALGPQSAKIHIIQGDAWMKQKLTQPAINEYMKAVAIDSQNLDVWVKLSAAQYKARQYNDAAKSFQTVLKLDPSNMSALRGLGNMLYRSRQYVVALPYIEKLAKQMPDSVDVQTKYVVCLSEAGRDSDLIPIAEKLLAKDASLAQIQEIRDKAYAKLKMNDKIIDSYKSRPLASLKVDDLVRYVKALQSEGMNKEAEEVYQALFAKDSSRCDMRYSYGTNEMKLKKYAEAVNQFEMKIACDTSAGYQFASHLNAAMSLMQMKKFKDAIDHIKKATGYRAENVQAWTLLAECYGQLDQIDEEITTYKKVIDLATTADDPKNESFLQEAYRMIGVRTLIRATKEPDKEKAKQLYAEAAKWLVKALALKSNDCEALLWAGQAYQNSNDKDNAIKYYKRTIATCPGTKQAGDAQRGLDTLGPVK
jgi:tetratricopeptide (TPR) repeat protein